LRRCKEAATAERLKTIDIRATANEDPNVVQQAFKAQINFHDSEGKEIGKAWVHVVSSFVNSTKWSRGKQSLRTKEKE
jgi:hypothetical protein